MTQQGNLSEFLSWWNEFNFPGKELFTLQESGELIVHPFSGNKERVIAIINEDNAMASVKALSDKFSELELKLQELATEWECTEDKLKLIPKIDRLKDLVNTTHAVGDLKALAGQIEGWEAVLKEKQDNVHHARLAIVEAAEKLIDSEQWKETTQAFREFFEQWKTLGQGTKAKNDVLWNRLEEARNKFYERKRQYQEGVERELMQNLDLKMEMVEKAEALKNSTQWKETSEAFKNLMEEWKKTGRTVHDKNEELWNSFINAKNAFFDRKKEHFDQIQKEQTQNLILKQALLEKAEMLKDSTEWNATTQSYNELMEEWKKIGRVPAEFSDIIWEKLNAAKDHFFNNKRTHFDSVRTSLEDNLVKKRELLQRAEVLKNSTQWRETTLEMNDLMDEWKTLGAVPREHSNKIWEAFLAARRTFFDRKDAHFDDRRKFAEKQAQGRLQQTRSLVGKLEDEIKEEEEKIADFKNGLENISPGRKAEELRKHLTNLIAEGEQLIVKKREKLEQVKKDLEQSDRKSKDKNDSKKVEEV
jgi:hypothetical protein